MSLIEEVLMIRALLSSKVQFEVATTKESIKHRQDIFSDPGIGSKTESQSAAAAITKWRKQQSVESVDKDRERSGSNRNGGIEIESEFNALVSPLSDTNEKPEWTIFDLMRQKNSNRESNQTIQKDNPNREDSF